MPNTKTSAEAKAAEAGLDREAVPAEPPPSYETAASKGAPPPGQAGRPPPPGPRPPFPLDLPALNAIRGKRVILASASPRRRHLLGLLSIPNLEIQPCPLPEDLPQDGSPFSYVLRTAERKAMHVYTSSLNDRTKGDPALLIAADTIIVSPGGTIYEKPRNEAQHLSMLQSLRDAQGRRHSVVTGVAVMAPLESARDPGYRLLTAVEETVVVFDREVTDDMLRAYVRTREGADKAGGYGIQGLGGLLVERIEGAWDTVVGLPLRVTLKLIEKVLDQSAEVEEEFDPEEEVVA